MKALLAALPLLLSVLPASAGMLTCQFTEPFFSLAFDSATGILTLTSADDADPETGKIEPKVIAESAKLRLADGWTGYQTLELMAGGNKILELKMSGQGSDGMSDTVFPLDGHYGNLVGGCETSMAPAYDANEMFQDLGVEP
jgi:uncharacterized membrane protein